MQPRQGQCPLLSCADDLPQSSLLRRTNIDSTVRHVTWGRDVEEEEHDRPALGNESEEEPEQGELEDFYDYGFLQTNDPDDETQLLFAFIVCLTI